MTNNAKRPADAGALVCPIRLIAQQLSQSPYSPTSFCIADMCPMWRWTNESLGNCGLASPHT
jgi:hypothetical protein